MNLVLDSRQSQPVSNLYASKQVLISRSICSLRLVYIELAERKVVCIDVIFSYIFQSHLTLRFWHTWNYLIHAPFQNINIVNVSRDSDPSSDTSTGQDEEPVWTWSFLDRVWVLKNRWDILKRLGSFCFMNILKAKVQRRVSWWPTRPLNLPKKTGQEIKAPTGIVAVHTRQQALLQQLWWRDRRRKTLRGWSWWRITFYRCQQQRFGEVLQDQIKLVSAKPSYMSAATMRMPQW